MSDKRDREVRKLFSIANAIAIDLLNEEEFQALTAHEIFENAMEIALDEVEAAPIKPTQMNVASVDKRNVAFVINEDVAIITGSEEFENEVFDAGINDNED